MFKKIIFCLLIFVVGLFLLSATVIWARMTSDGYIIFADVFSSGGDENSSSANYGLADTISEAIILSATTTSASYGLKAGFQEMYADQYLTFTIADAEIELGTLSDSAVSFDSNTMVVDTNATNGFTVTVSGDTLTSGGNTITAIGATAAASSPGTEQFGINLVDNATPDVGAAVSGTAPIGSAANQYNIADSFAFNSGDTVATSTSDINQTTYTVSYIANIDSSTESGAYTATLVYSATANF